MATTFISSTQNASNSFKCIEEVPEAIADVAVVMVVMGGSL
jgi:hypothetical protein